MDVALIFVLTAVLAFTQFATAWYGREMAPARFGDKPLLALSAIALFAAVGIAATTTADEISPEWQYARLVPVGSVGDKVIFFFRATANLQSVSYARYTTSNLNMGAYTLIPLIRKGMESLPREALSQGDWTFDIDALGDYGKVLQRIIIDDDANGKPAVIYSRVMRKFVGSVICQSPKRRFAPSC
jgi:hypothetical protein